MLAAGCVCTALQGLLGRKCCADMQLAAHLQAITNIDQVRALSVVLSLTCHRGRVVDLARRGIEINDVHC